MSNKQVILLTILLFIFAASILANKVDAGEPDMPDSPDTCEVIGDAWINWWSNTKLIVWWECSKTRRTEQWSCWVQVESPSRQTYDLIWTDQTPGLFDYTSLEIDFPFWTELGIWRAVNGRCWAEGRINNQWTTLYEREITHNGYPLQQWHYEQLIGGLDVSLELEIYIPLIVH